MELRDVSITPKARSPSANDKETLQAIYTAAGGDQWEYESGWMSPAYVDKAGLVTSLNLNSYNLSGIAVYHSTSH